MGSAVSTVHAWNRTLAECKRDFTILGINEHESRQLFKFFSKIDVDASGSIQKLELLDFLDIDRTIFSRQVFSAMDEDGNGNIDFREFVISLWNYCTLGHDALTLFTFDIYDTNCDNKINLKEMEKLLKDLYGKKYQSNDYAMKLFHKVELDHEIQFLEFRDFCRKHNCILFPAFEIQRRIQKKVLGKSFWKRLSQKRLVMIGDKAFHTKDLIGLKLNKLEFDHLFSDPVLQDTYPLQRIEQILNVSHNRHSRPVTASDIPTLRAKVVQQQEEAAAHAEALLQLKLKNGNKQCQNGKLKVKKSTSNASDTSKAEEENCNSRPPSRGRKSNQTPSPKNQSFDYSTVNQSSSETPKRRSSMPNLPHPSPSSFDPNAIQPTRRMVPIVDVCEDLDETDFVLQAPPSRRRASHS